MSLTDAQLLTRRCRPAFSDNTMAVICERHFGWEMADFATLARIFGTSPQHIAAICRTHKPARVSHGAGNLASDLASPSPRAGSDAPSDHSFAHAATSTSQEQHNHG